MSRVVERIRELTEAHGTVTASLVKRHGINRRMLGRLVESGELVRVARGVYAAADGTESVTAHHGLAVASRRVPGGVICLLSALRFREIGTQVPAEVWLGLPRGSRSPAEESICAVHYSRKSFAVGIEHHLIEGVEVPIYSPAKTVADCFKFRHRVGLEAAMEALRETVHNRKATVAEIFGFAEACRIRTVITPYLQALA